MASEKTKKKKETKPVKPIAAIALVVSAFVAMALFVGYIVNPPSSDESKGEYSGTQKFDGEASESDLELGTTKEVLAEADVFDIVLFGHLEQDGNKENGSEAIEWIVLEKSEDKLLLISRDCIGTYKYNTSERECVWETSDLRKYLNDQVAPKAFTEAEQDLISEKTYEGFDFSDRLFVPSKAEAKKYFEKDSYRKAKPTAFAASAGVRVQNGYCWWWLRDAGEIDNSASYVYFDGSVRENGFSVDYDTVGVRPMMYVSIAD